VIAVIGCAAQPTRVWIQSPGGRTAARPVLRTRYERSTLVLAERVRVTIDLGLEASTPEGLDLRLMGMAVVETKTRGPTSDADRGLWAMGHRPVRISKFGTSLAALHPDLPSNRWTRALSRPWIMTGRPPRSPKRCSAALRGTTTFVG
jgi:hypothetical protein